MKGRDDQNECIVEILTEHATKKGTNHDKSRKNVNVSPTGKGLAKTFQPRGVRDRPRGEVR